MGQPLNHNGSAMINLSNEQLLRVSAASSTTEWLDSTLESGVQAGFFVGGLTGLLSHGLGGACLGSLLGATFGGMGALFFVATPIALLSQS
jgi:hypothetical protein